MVRGSVSGEVGRTPPPNFSGNTPPGFGSLIKYNIIEKIGVKVQNESKILVPEV